MNDETIDIASSLCTSPVSELTQVSASGNSRVYKATTDTAHYALKQYPTSEHDPRDRIGAEHKALALMAKHGISSVPRWIASEGPYALMSWIDGSVITAPTAADIDDCAVFLGTLHHISGKIAASDIAPASEACTSGQLIIEQLEKRVSALMPHSKENPALMKFLSSQFLPIFRDRLLAAKRAYPEFAEPLPHAKQTLIAADFGFHNILRGNDKKLYFLDFEYFGWDDPCKLMCDFLLHPATTLSPLLQAYFYNHMLSIYGEHIAPRFGAYYPLFGLRWTLILLNEFLPDRWQARQNARAYGDWESVKTEQLAKAEAMLAMSHTFTA